MKKIAIILLIISAYLIWPYLQLWRLQCAAIQNNQQLLANLVDLTAVRESIKRRLNKDLPESNISPSDIFINWIQDGLHRMGNQAIEQLVTLDWVQQQILSNLIPGILYCSPNNISYAFFIQLNQFLARIGKIENNPVYIKFKLTTHGWQVIMVYN